jgi:hypothetical protein
MQKHSIFQSRTTSVVAGSALLVTLGGVSGAFAAATITSQDIKNGEVKKADIDADAVGGSELRKGAVGFGKLKNSVSAKINESAPAANPRYRPPIGGSLTATRSATATPTFAPDRLPRATSPRRPVSGVSGCAPAPVPTRPASVTRWTSPATSSPTWTP